MTRFPNVDHAWRIGVVELRRSWRATVEKGTAQVGALAIAALFGIAFTLGATAGAYFAGRGLATGDLSDPLAGGALVSAGLWVIVFAMTTYLTALQLCDVDNETAMLSTVPHRDVVGGLLVSGFVRVGGLFGAPLVIAGGGFAVGAGSVVSFPLVAVAVVLDVTSAYVVGFAAGVAARYALGRSSLVARYKTLLGVAAFLAYMALIFTNSLGEVFAPAVQALQGSPVGWYADLATLAVADAASPLAALGAVALTAVAIVASVLASVVVSGMRWYADPVHVDATDEPTATGERAADWLDAVLDRPTAWVVRRCWLRARRAPITLVYVAYPLFVLAGPIQQSVQAGRVSPTLPATLALYGAWATGAAFTLNPIGDEGAVLPITATTPVGGERYVRGRMIAGLAVGLPVTVLLVLALGVASSVGLAATLGTAVAAVPLCVAATAIAAGVGTAYPRFDATNVTRSREVVVPSTWAFLGYTLVVLLLGAPATILQIPQLLAWLVDVTGVPAGAFRVGGVAVSVLLLAPVAVWGRRYAVRAFDSFAFD